MPETIDAAQSDLQCPRCGGQTAFDPSETALKCTSCGHARRIAHVDIEDAAREVDYCPDDPGTDVPVLAKTRTHQCRTCGGEVIFTGASLSERCAYCDGPVVLKDGDEGYRTMALIPFQLRDGFAWGQARDWIARRWAAPNDLAKQVEQGRMAGIYVPFFTFDSEEALQYWGTYTVRRNKKTYTKRVSGNMQIRFDDMLVPASPHITPLIRDGVLHDFRPDTLKPYHPGYLAGFAAERHHLSVTEGLAANADDKDLLIRNRIEGHAGRKLDSIRYQTDTSGLRYRRILLPVWIVHYTYLGKPMKVVVCGLHGQTYGERPFSTWKLMGMSAALTGAALALGIAWGVLGFL
ncbi:MAG: hypothetical protein AAGM84_09295 [Pseudomonadota bacterium]